VNGKVSALLELGTGFNPEFTGIQNVYMNGAIMGYGKSDMDERLHDIIAFAEIGGFINQPVKTYSSGMLVRLAFACAVNVDPEVLIIDEALSVGDSKFQKKCYDKMNVFKDRGRTIIWVTHGSIKNFASTGLVLDQGRQLYIGESKEAELKYMQLLYPKSEKLAERKLTDASEMTIDEVKKETKEDKTEYCLEVIPSREDVKESFGGGGGWIKWIKIYGLEKPNMFHGGDTLIIKIAAEWDKEYIKEIVKERNLLNNLIVGCGCDNQKSITMFGFNIYEKGCLIDPIRNSEGYITFKIYLPNLKSGSYFIYPAIAIGSQEQHIQLRWYPNLVQLQCISDPKYEFGEIKIDYRVDDLTCH
jgi:lipopolysaccharide transport system ATP-binding protein